MWVVRPQCRYGVCEVMCSLCILWHKIAEPRQAEPPKRDCPAGVGARVERPKQLELNGNEEAAVPAE